MKKKSTSKSAFFNLRFLIGCVLCVIGVLVALLGSGAFSNLFAQTKGTRQAGAPTRQDAPGTQMPDVVPMVGPVRLNQDLRSLPYIPPTPMEPETPLTRYPHGTPESGAQLRSGISGLRNVQALLKNVWRPTPTMPPPLLTFEGMNATGFAPPDTMGDVGPNHYVEAVNVSFRVFDKNGNPLAPATTFNSFFAPLGGGCGTNFGKTDPFVFYDHQADRWVITILSFQGLPGNSSFECIGVSQGPDPVAGPWTLYGVQTDPANPNFVGDYPKLAMWNAGGNPAQNAYFLTANLFSGPTTFNGVRAYALDRASMLAGGPTNAIGFTIPPAGLGDSYSLVAANFRTGTPPPAGRDEFLLAVDSPLNENTTLTQVKGWLFHVDFGTPANSTLGVGANHGPNSLITVSPFVEAWTNAQGFSIVPQQGVPDKIQTLGDKIMTPVVYQNLGGTESLWADQTVMVSFPAGPSAVRWYQFDVTGGGFPANAAQQQTFSNGGDGVWRFMPSIAVDQSGNTAIGYAASSPSLFPGIRYAGRLAGDPPNDLSQGENTLFTGTGSQQDTVNRWGDYTMTTIDPANGMDFWHVGEYYATTSSFNWHTRIGKFNFQGGGISPTPTPTATPASCSWAAGPSLPDPPATLVRAVGVYFPADGNFYSVGGRTADTAGSDFQHVLRYSSATNSWTLMGVTLPDNSMNNMACGVLNDSGTDYIYCVGGSFAGGTTATDRVFRYDPVTDNATVVGSPWPGAMGTILPGGFSVFNNKLYIFGGFNINVGMVDTIWEFTPNPAGWVQKNAHLPVALGYIPTGTIGDLIYMAGGSTWDGTTIHDSSNTASYDPVADSIGTIATIPRATAETRGLNFCNKLYVMGGGRDAPNPSNEVDVYDPSTNSWSTDLPFTNPRRNFPTDTNHSDHIWLAGGYEPSTPAGDMEIFSCPVSPCAPSPTPTPTATATATATPTPTATPAPRPTPTPRQRPTPPPRP